MSGSQEEVGFIEILVECPFCGGYVPDDFECLKCGSEILEQIGDEYTIFICSVCRSEVTDGAEYCPSCDALLE